MKILFMGTPEFAVPSLTLIYESAHELVGVVTAPDKPVGRGLKIKPSPIKQKALEFDLQLFQPIDLKDSEFSPEIRKLNPDLFVVVAFRILPPEVFELPPQGTINLHSSLLPKYRGAAPINWAIINGEKETGVTTIMIQQKVDTGDIILQKKVQIGDDETAGELHDKLANLGAELLLESINLIAAGNASPKIQTGTGTKAPKLTKELGLINWDEPSGQIRNLIRGLNPYPGAYTFLNSKLIKLFRAQLIENSNSDHRPGEITGVDPRNGLIQIATGSGNLQVTELQPEGKRRMTAAEYLKGYQLKVGDRKSVV